MKDSTADTSGTDTWVRPHLGYLRSGIYHLWDSLPRRMGSPDVYSTYYVMALACDVDLEGLPYEDPKRKFIRKMTTEQCLMIAEAVLEDPGGNPSRFNPLALLHRGSSHIKSAQSWATVIRLHVKHQHLRHLLVEACVHMNTQAEARRVAEEKKAARLAAEKRQDAVRYEVQRQETQRRHQTRIAVGHMTRQHGRRHGENLRAYLEGHSLPYPYRCTVCGKITKHEDGLRAHVAAKHGDRPRSEAVGEVMITPIGVDATLRDVGLRIVGARPGTGTPAPANKDQETLT